MTSSSVHLDPTWLAALTDALEAAVRIELERLCAVAPADHRSRDGGLFEAQLEQAERAKGLLDLLRSRHPANWGSIGWSAADGGGGVLVWSEADRLMLRRILVRTAQCVAEQEAAAATFIAEFLSKL